MKYVYNQAIIKFLSRYTGYSEETVAKVGAGGISYLRAYSRLGGYNGFYARKIRPNA
jgi:hypothetical protein